MGYELKILHIIFIYFFNYFGCPRRCAYTILEDFTIFLSIVLHGNFYRFLWFCHENKVWYWVHFVIPPLPVRIETATLAFYPSASKDLVLQHHALSGYRLSTVYTMYSIIVHGFKGEGIQPGSSQCQLEVC